MHTTTHTGSIRVDGSLYQHHCIYGVAAWYEVRGNVFRRVHNLTLIDRLDTLHEEKESVGSVVLS